MVTNALAHIACMFISDTGRPIGALNDGSLY